jgi:hypothetical protein
MSPKSDPRATVAADAATKKRRQQRTRRISERERQEGLPFDDAARWLLKHDPELVEDEPVEGREAAQSPAEPDRGEGKREGARRRPGAGRRLRVAAHAPRGVDPADCSHPFWASIVSTPDGPAAHLFCPFCKTRRPAA